MSVELGQFNTTISPDDVSYALYVTSFWGGSRGPCLQFTIGGNFVQLNEKSAIELKHTIEKWLDRI